MLSVGLGRIVYVSEMRVERERRAKLPVWLCSTGSRRTDDGQVF